MAAKGTIVLTIGTENQKDTDLLQKYTKAVSEEPKTGINDLMNLLASLGSGIESGTIRVGVEAGDTGAGVFTDASVTVLRTYRCGI